MELIVLALFGIVLCFCVATGQSVVYALIWGYFSFAVYGMTRKMTIKELGAITLKGIRTVKNILITFILIGMLTASWRACGTIAIIIVAAMKIITPAVFLALTFLLCSCISMLTGTSFGTAGTIGVICMTMGRSIGLSPIWLGGAILSGAFVGDRNSPMSTSALLVAEMTGTDIYRNIKNMLRTGWLPFLLSTGIYLAAGFLQAGNIAGDSYLQIRQELTLLFQSFFTLHPFAFLPAAVILICSLAKMNVKKTMAISILLSVICALAFEKIPVPTLLNLLVNGYRAEDEAVGALLNGGGILSMKKVFFIVCISSTYAGLFERTGILKRPKEALFHLKDKLGEFLTVCLTGVLTAMLACNQSLATILTAEFCRGIYREQEDLALSIENTVIVIAAMIPWSIAGTAPLTALGAPLSAIFAACFLYLIPIYNILLSLVRREQAV